MQESCFVDTNDQKILKEESGELTGNLWLLLIYSAKVVPNGRDLIPSKQLSLNYKLS